MVFEFFMTLDPVQAAFAAGLAILVSHFMMSESDYAD